VPDAANRASWPPRWLTPALPDEVERGDGDECCAFVDAFGRIVKDSVAGPSGAPLELRGWQRDLTSHLLARRESDGRYRFRQALIGIARKNGKSGWLQEFGKWALFLGPDGGEVYSCAGDRDQARIVFGAAKRSIEMEPELAEQVKLYRDAIEVPSTGSIWRVLSAEAYTKEGLSPSVVLFDEVHVQPNRELWDVMALAQGARPEPLMVGITTAGVRTDTLGNDSLCYGLYQYGKRVAAGEVDDDSFFFAWWEPEAAEKADHCDPKVWAEANPGLGDLVSLEDFESSVKRTPESEFRTKRTNIFVVGRDAALPHGRWDERAEPRDVAPDERIVLFTDGSWNGDCTAIVGATLGPEPYLFRVGLWERPPDDQHWRVPVPEVVECIIESCRRWQVEEVCFDPFRWQHTMSVLEDDHGLPIVEYHTAQAARIVPAWKAFYDAVVDGTLTHDGDPALARHVENMVLKIDAKGARPVKDARTSQRHIDLGICAICAHDRARLAVPEQPLDFVGAWA
jgi:phage terminase large subunit-like protein